MRLFANSTPKSSPELVRHSQVTTSSNNNNIAGEHQQQHGGGGGGGLVTTLGRKFSRRFERLGESSAGEAARRLHRMASPSSRKSYHWALGGSGGGGGGALSESDGEEMTPASEGNKRRVSRVDSFRNFLSLMATSAVSSSNSNNNSGSNCGTLRTPRAVKRRSDHGKGSRSVLIRSLSPELCECTLS